MLGRCARSSADRPVPVKPKALEPSGRSTVSSGAPRTPSSWLDSPPRRTTAARAPWRTASPTRTRRWRASRVAEAAAPRPGAPGQLVAARTALAPARPGVPGPTTVGTAVGEDRRLPGEPAPPGAPDEHPVVSRDGHGVREVGFFAALPGSTEPLPVGCADAPSRALDRPSGHPPPLLGDRRAGGGGRGDAGGRTDAVRRAVGVDDRLAERDPAARVQRVALGGGQRRVAASRRPSPGRSDASSCTGGGRWRTA